MLAIHDYTLPLAKPMLSVDHWDTSRQIEGTMDVESRVYLKVLVGETLPRDGRLSQRKDFQLGYLPQKAVSGSTRPVWDEVKSGMTRLLKLEAHLQTCEEDVDSEAGQIALIEAMDAYRHAGGYQQEERIGSTLHGLGFAREDWHKTCDTFSGGWQMRIALAKLLLVRSRFGCTRRAYQSLGCTPPKNG